MSLPLPRLQPAGEAGRQRPAPLPRPSAGELAQEPQRRAAQLQDAASQAGPHCEGVSSAIIPVPHEAHAKAPGSLIHIGRGDEHCDARVDFHLWTGRVAQPETR